MLTLLLVFQTEMASSQDEMQVYARLNQLNELLAHDRNNSAYLRERGDIHYMMNDFINAARDYSDAIRCNDRNDEAYFGRGMALGRMGKVDEGIADLTIYLERHPDSSVAYTKRGVRNIWRAHLQDAEHDLKRAIELDPANAEAHDDLGVVYSKNKRLDLASRHFAKAIELDPGYQKAYHNLAICLFLAQKPDKALTVINAGLKLAPEDKNSLLLKSAILHELGDYTAAKEIADNAEFLPDGNWSERTGIQNKQLESKR